MLVDECEKGNVTFRLRSEVLSVAKDETGFTLELNGMTVGSDFHFSKYCAWKRR